MIYLLCVDSPGVVGKGNEVARQLAILHEALVGVLVELNFRLYRISVGLVLVQNLQDGRKLCQSDWDVDGLN